MNRPPLEVADIVRTYGDAFVERHRRWLTLQHLRVLRGIAACRTAVLGGHLDRCDRCGYQAISYNSCRLRHCPKCQGSARQLWLAERSAELLPVPYYHVVFHPAAPSRTPGLAEQGARLFWISAVSVCRPAFLHLSCPLGCIAASNVGGGLWSSRKCSPQPDFPCCSPPHLARRTRHDQNHLCLYIHNVSY